MMNSAISVLRECETVMKNVLQTSARAAALTERFFSWDKAPVFLGA